MGLLVALLGKSASGKDTLLRRLARERGLLPVVPCTTRPRRPGEREGVDYHFLSREEFSRRAAAGEFIETRAYHTLYRGTPDVWYYATARAGIDLSRASYAAIVDLDALAALRREFGGSLLAVYLDVPEPVRRARCVARGDFSPPEWARREADDAGKYTPDALSGIDLILGEEDGEAAFARLAARLAAHPDGRV